MKKIKIISAIVMLMFLLTQVLGCSGGQKAAPVEETIRIGTIFPLSGPSALNGQDTFDGADIARELFNDKGGINGKKVVYVSADAPDANAATQEADRLISKEKVPVILGTQSSSLAFAASAVAERNKVVYWEVEGIADNITSRNFKYVFRSTFSASNMGLQMVNFVKDVYAPKMGKTIQDLKIALVYEDGAFGSSTAKTIQDLSKELGFTFVKEASYSAKSNELNSLVIDLKAKKPDVLFAASYVNDAILLSRTSEELGFKPGIIIGTTAGHGTPDYVKAMGDKSNGVFAAGIPNAVNPDNMKPEQKDLYNELTKRYKAKRNKDISVNVLNGFNGAWILLSKVLPNAKEMTADNIRDVALNTTMAKGDTVLGYGVKFAGPDAPNSGQNVEAFAGVMQWQEGKLYTVFPEIIALKQPKF
ncbi:MAG: Leu/Ile/Val-binding protein [Candidatus Dichloromethanomonas elyunquensis]|nr:MAG: Leu/Ile/Val-binding protein [Candidatus Dichloromethanomonas elyunquensis]